ncbi:hypothetical protein, partial [Mesorhizobium sp.]|uniref:hypothetical protein n=2 Tax=Mesorhizobium sp. TaxID=1871066 RepID=UPI0025EDBB80
SFVRQSTALAYASASISIDLNRYLVRHPDDLGKLGRAGAFPGAREARRPMWTLDFTPHLRCFGLVSSLSIKRAQLSGRALIHC